MTDRERIPTTPAAAADHEPPAAAPGLAAAMAHLNRGNSLLASARLDEARGAYQLAIACAPQYAPAHFNLGNLNYRAGEFAHALRNYQATVSLQPEFTDAYVGMANALLGLGRSAEAIASYRRAVAIDPGHAEAHFNLGVLAMAEGRLPEAATSLRRATELRPGHAAAHRILGAVSSSRGDLDAAEASLRRAASLEPESAEIRSELAMILQYRGSYLEAAQLLARALERAPDPTTRAAFAGCAARTRFTADDPLIRRALTAAIAEAWAMPHDLCRPALSLIMLDESIGGCVRRANESWPARPPGAALFGAGGLEALAADPLLHAVLDAVPVNSVQFERFLTCARHALLEIASTRQTDPGETSALEFYAALARQCFINEFVFDCTDEERLAAESCRRTLAGLLEANAAVPALQLLAVAAYFPLHLLPGADRLLAASAPPAVAEVLRQQIREPLAEQALRAGIERLTPITGKVAAAVRDQYEENPYPRWVRMHLRAEPLLFNAELRRALPGAQFVPLADDSAPEILVAGCGTGSDAIFVARRFRGAHVLAIDLSLGSLGYAKRKTRELGLTNIDYAQADILELARLARTFDVIGAVGVLHHLADPFEGWRILLSRLRPGGFMCLGLYSQIARRAAVKVREFVAARGYAPTADDIRRFRQDALAEHTSVELRSLRNSHAFYSMSDCRDLAFHVQEQPLTLQQVESFLTESALDFLGFELDPGVLNQYRARFDDDPSGTSLRNWARFEAENPDTFTAMYRFWIQRPPGPR
jgi:tetratricopeptide (TPR) repeat protein/2-polyprenyl-3-methyl-5-hydroxy-6-metoxy-1,4-benzoquinol methylase